MWRGSEGDTVSDYSKWGKTVTRYVITFVPGRGPMAFVRTLALPGQGHYTWSTYAEAASQLEAFSQPHGLPRVLSPLEVSTLRVDPCECWDVHFDPCGVYFDE